MRVKLIVEYPSAYAASKLAKALNEGFEIQSTVGVGPYIVYTLISHDDEDQESPR